MPDLGIKLHHIIAAADEFSKFSMYWDLMPSAKLNYIHDFRGFFNCISQVMFGSRQFGELASDLQWRRWCTFTCQTTSGDPR